MKQLTFTFEYFFTDDLDRAGHDIVSNYFEGKMWQEFNFWIILYISFGQGKTWDDVKLVWGENETGI